MSEHTGGAHSGSDELWRWLLGGLAAGGIILGLLIAAYAIGYHRGQHQPGTAAAPASPTTPASTTTTAPPATTPSPAPGPVKATPALIARGKTLYTADGCSACHSLTGKAGVGPSLQGIAGRKVTLTDGQTITADDAYLEQSIVDPDSKSSRATAPASCRQRSQATTSPASPTTSAHLSPSSRRRNKEHEELDTNRSS